MEGSDLESVELLQNVKWVLKFKKKLLSSFSELKQHVEPCCVVLCRTENQTCARRQEKQALDRARWGRGVFSI